MSSDRRRHQREVERLLEQIGETVARIRLSTERGARAPALREQKRELSRARRELAALVAASSH
jgi:hypothetical protein